MACDRCGGSGWIVIERDGLSAAEPCACAAAEPGPRDLESSANIPPLYSHASFDNFLLEGRWQLEKVMLDAKHYAREGPTNLPKPGLMFIGPTGTGKTHLAVAVLRSLIARGFEGIFYDYINLLERIRSGYDADAPASDREAYQACLETPVLLIDDLGSHRVMGWIEDTVTAIITHRCNHGKALIVTTNLADPDAGDTIVQRARGGASVEYRITLAEKIGERARSRLFEMCKVIRMPSVGDYRITKK
jgi:DNA replication protein DnaC